jgi:hypothetical protein
MSVGWGQRVRWLTGAVAALAALGAFAAAASAQTAVLRGLDKVTGHARDFTARLNQPTAFGSLQVVVRACHKRSAEETPEVAIYLQVFDAPGENAAQGSDRQEIFSGWIFASSPGLNALEHPVYDIWAMDCRP